MPKPLTGNRMQDRIVIPVSRPDRRFCPGEGDTKAVTVPEKSMEMPPEGIVFA